MSKTIIPDGYKCKMSLYDTQKAIAKVKRFFQDELAKSLNLMRVSAPLFVTKDSGVNDNLNGTERPVEFDIREDGSYAQVVHSLAKWKRVALKKYDIYVGKGIYTDMNAIRRDEDMDNLHSIYVDQWDWERVIIAEDRNIGFLKEIVNKIVGVICDTKDYINSEYCLLNTSLSRDVSFITSQELEDMYPSLTPKEREDAYLKEHRTAFIMQIGGTLRSGQKHDGRAPDYDDWSLNGDIFFWNETLGCAFEISSMGIRVDPESLDRQLTLSGCDYRRGYPFHKALLNNELPLSIGGGIGQSRLCMLLLEKAHIGEVQVSIWDKDTEEACKKAGIILL